MDDADATGGAISRARARLRLWRQRMRREDVPSRTVRVADAGEAPGTSAPGEPQDKPEFYYADGFFRAWAYTIDNSGRVLTAGLLLLFIGVFVLMLVGGVVGLVRLEADSLGSAGRWLVEHARFIGVIMTSGGAVTLFRAWSRRRRATPPLDASTTRDDG